jgi:hypothetical protein
MLDYYSVSGCYVLKPWSYSIWEIIQGIGLFTSTLSDGTYSDRTKNGSTRRLRRWALKMHISPCSCHKKCWSGKRITSRVSPPKLLGLRERASMGTRHCYAWTGTDHAILEASQISKNPSRSVLRRKPPCILVRLISTSVCCLLTTTKITQSGSRATEIFR